MGAAHTRRIVDSSVIQTVRGQLGDSSLGLSEHLLPRPEGDGIGRAGLYARRLESRADAVRAQRALVDLPRRRADPGDVERAARHTELAADAVLLHEVDDAVGVLHDRPGRRTGLQTPRVFAVHALVFGQRPQQPPVALGFVELDALPEVVLQIGSVWYVCGGDSRISSTFKSFHSWQATSQALHPMHTETSISLVSSGTSLMPAAVCGEADTALTCRAEALDTGLIASHLFELHEEAFVLRAKRVRVHDRGRGDVREAAALLAQSNEPPVDRHTNLVNFLARDGHGLDPLGQQSVALDVTPG